MCSLLQIDQLLLLLDCGWDDTYDVESLRPLNNVIGHVHGVLITHPDPAHLGALPYLVGRLKLSVPVYATFPVQKMGEIFMYDQYVTRHAVSDFAAFNLDDVDEAFARITPLKYQQTLTLEGPGEGFSITPFAAGHLLGGCIWRITTPEEEHIVYAVHYNHKKERHLNGGVLDSFSRPAVLITDADNALGEAVRSREALDKELREAIMATLRRNGNVLLPVDAAGRLLELVLLLEEHWDKQKLMYPLVLLTPMAYNVLELASSQLEWMSHHVGQMFERTKHNPFSVRQLKLCRSVEELAKLPPGPRVVMATLPSLEAGGSRQLLAEWADKPANLILFTGRAPSGTLAGLLQHNLHSGQAFTVPLQLSKRVPLQGDELQAWQASQTAHVVDEDAMANQHAPVELPSRMSTESIGKISRSSSGSAKLLLSSSASKRASANVLIDGFVVPEGAVAPMFPFEDDENEYDEYGATLQPGEFQQADGRSAGLPMEMDIDEDGPDREEMPTKVVVEDTKLIVHAQLMQLDYDGRSDGRSMRLILSKVAPRHLVLMHGLPQATEILRDACAEDLYPVNGQVHCPGNGETVDLSAGTASFQVGLSDGLLSQLQMRQMGKEYALAWVHGVVASVNTGKLPEILPAEASADEALEGGVFIGDAKLSDLKTALEKEGIAAAFVEGHLQCSGSVSVKRTVPEDGGIILEGPLSDDYYRIRAVLYSQYQVC
ncbi:g7226 [Coccomyxa elongata]